MCISNNNRIVRHTDFVPQVPALLLVTVVVILSFRLFDFTVAALLLTTLLSVACYYDLTRFRIPNWLTYSSAICAVSSNVIGSLILYWRGTNASPWLGSIGVAQSLFGFLVGFGVMSFVFALAGRGAGDLKLVSAIGAVVGPVNVLSIIFVAHLLAATFAAAWVIYQIGPLTLLRMVGRNVGNSVFPGRIAPSQYAVESALHQPIPLAGFFALGSLLVIGGIAK